MRDQRISPVEQLHREALVANARHHVYVPDGQPAVRFSDAEAERLGFLLWRIASGELERTEPPVHGRSARRRR